MEFKKIQKKKFISHKKWLGDDVLFKLRSSFSNLTKETLSKILVKITRKEAEENGFHVSACSYCKCSAISVNMHHLDSKFYKPENRLICPACKLNNTVNSQTGRCILVEDCVILNNQHFHVEEAKEYVIKCTNCEEETLKNNNLKLTISVDDYDPKTKKILDKFICDKCAKAEAQNLVRCAASRGLVHKEVAIFHDGQYYHPEDMKYIEAYNHKPRPKFKKLKGESTKQYYGIELEINTPSFHAPHRYAYKVKGIMNGDCYFKHDGSVGHGFEIVYEPMTYEYIKKYDFRSKLIALSKAGFNSYNNNKCGLHVHVSADAMTKIQWWKIYHFFSNNANFIKEFSKRRSSEIERWCAIQSISNIKRYIEYNYGTVKKGSPHSYMSKWPCHDTKYIALNNTGKTIEFRIFKGTLSYNRFFASIQLIDALLQAAREISIKKFITGDFNKREFINYLSNKPEYSHLYKYLIGTLKKQDLSKANYYEQLAKAS